MSRISEVADRAGVSAMTVSRVVNNSGYVSAATRQRVEQAIAQLGYVPNALARQLRSKRTTMLALVVSDISNPFFTTIARGVEDAASARGFAVMFCNTDESSDEEARYLRLLVERQVDGVLLVPAENAAASLRLLRTHQIPVVVLDRRVSRRVDNVRCDSEAGAYALARHLIELGHRRIAVLTGRRGISTSVDRVAGVRRALGEVGLALDESLVRYGGFNFGSANLADGRHMAEEVLAASDDPPTAIFAANNFIAFGAVRALRELGLSVPEDISVVAFDDLPVEWVERPLPDRRCPARVRDRASGSRDDDRPPGRRANRGGRVGGAAVRGDRAAVHRDAAGPGDVGPDPCAGGRLDRPRKRRAKPGGGPRPMTAEASDTGTQPPALEPIDPALVPRRALAGGAWMPAIGLGTFGSDRVPGERVAAAVHDAIRLGYRHIDCAAVYGNEHLIGESLEQAMADGVRRDELWITSKLWNDNHEPAKVAPALERSLRDLRLDHLDLYLVHWPFPNTHQPGVDVGSRDSHAQPYRHERFMETWAALETARGARAGAAHRDVEHDDPQAPPRPG